MHQNVFNVDELEHRGATNVLSIRARSADFRDTLNIKREQSYHDVTLGAIMQTAAARHKLKSTVNGKLAGITIEHVDQTNESDASFLTRLVDAWRHRLRKKRRAADANRLQQKRQRTAASGGEYYPRRRR